MNVQIKAGKMRDRLTLQRPKRNRDNQGGVDSVAWEDVGTVWANIRTLSSSSYSEMERFLENQFRRVNHYLITIRYQKVTTDMRFKHGSRIFEIESVVNIDEINWKISLYCREDG